MLFVAGIAVLVLNLDRLLLGQGAPLRRLDVTDVLISNFQYGGQFWRDPAHFGWNSSMLGGWPIHLGTVPPQHLCSILSAFLPASLSFTFFYILLEALIFSGAFLFFYHFLGYRRQTAFIAAIFNLATYYWFNENPYVTQVSFLPLVAALTTVGHRGIPWAVRLSLLALMFFLSFPPYTVPMMPLVHLLLIWFLSPRTARKFNLLAWLAFWAIFLVFSLPNVLGIAMHWADSNRVLWDAQAAGFDPARLWRLMRYINPWYPVVCGIALFSFWRPGPARILLMIIGAILLFTSQSDLLNGIPGLSALSFAWTRTYYFIGFFWVMILAVLMEQYPQGRSKGHLVKAVMLAGVGALCLGSTFSWRAALAFAILGAGCVFLIHWDLGARADTRMKMLLLALAVLLPFRGIQSLHYEQLSYGFLYNDPFKYESPMRAYRIISVSDECIPHYFYAAQARIKGEETLDGVSVFYNGNDARNWRRFILLDQDPCRFKEWNNRVELTKAAWDRRADDIIDWLRFNNVAFVRSELPLEHPELILDQRKNVVIHEWTTSFEKEWYLYRVSDPRTRVMAIPEGVIDDLPEQIMAAAENVPLLSYAPAELSWQGNFDGQILLASMNYHPGWRLYVNGQPAAKSPERGPFGLVQISPEGGDNSYVLRYNDSLHRNVLLAIIIGLFLLIIFIVRLRRYEKSLLGP